jgi:hypothetical protein
MFFIFNGPAGTESSQDEHELQEEYEEGKLDESPEQRRERNYDRLDSKSELR